MISLRRSYKFARRRIDELRSGAFPDEALVLTMFLVEKLLRRTLVQLVIRSGIDTNAAFAEVKNLRGIGAVNNRWARFDSANRDLADVIGSATWEVIKDSASWRNDLVHGSANNGQRFYKSKLRALVAALDDIRLKFSSEYGYFGWRGMKDRNGKVL